MTKTEPEYLSVYSGLFDQPEHIPMADIRVGDAILTTPIGHNSAGWWIVDSFGRPLVGDVNLMVRVYLTGTERETGVSAIGIHYRSGVPYARRLRVNEYGQGYYRPEHGDSVVLGNGAPLGAVEQCLGRTRSGDPGGAANSGEWAVLVGFARGAGSRVYYVDAAAPERWVAGGGERQTGIPAWLKGRA